MSVTVEGIRTAGRMMNVESNQLTAQGVMATPPPSAIEPVQVLLIEDNPGDARLIRAFVAESAENSFEVEWVRRLDAGLERLGDPCIGVVLLDLSLPDSHGLETFLKLHSRAPNVPVVVLSGLADETVALQAVHEGAQDYLVKGQGDGRLLVRAMRYAVERATIASQLTRYAEQLRQKNAQMEADLHMAREIQQVFLPEHYPSFPPSVPSAQSALRFHHRYQPAAAVGGDFFTVFRVNDTAAGVFICDVMGHGLRAALITAVLRGLVEELKPGAMDPGQFLTEMNRGLHSILRRTDQVMMATALYLTVNATTGELQFSSAGHPSPLWMQRHCERVDFLHYEDARHGPALGLFENSTYPCCRCELRDRDLVVLFTDGIYEVVGPRGEEFGRERLLGEVQRRIHWPTADLFEELVMAARRFSGQTAFDDDVCLVGVELARSAHE
jgi:sigma-B regulation protein RsbU (phosphoserine phosphatase)